VVAKGQALDLGVQIVAEVIGQVLRELLRVVAAQEGEHRARRRKGDGRHQRREQRGKRRLGIHPELLHGSAHRHCRQSLGQLRQLQHPLGHVPAGDGVHDILQELRDGQLGQGRHDQAAVGHQRHLPEAPDVLYPAHQLREAVRRAHAAGRVPTRASPLYHRHLSQRFPSPW